MESKFTFTPCQINRGRKYKGPAYEVGDTPFVARSNYAYTAWSVRLWSPTERRYVYVNPEFIEDRDVSPDEVEADRKTYVDVIVRDTLNWCRQKQPSTTEECVRQFARNVLRKHHPELKSEIDKRLPDTSDIAEVIQKTLDWVRTLRTRPCVIYGKPCQGGKPYSESKQIEIARRTLARKGLTSNPDFETVWDTLLTINDFKRGKLSAV